MFAGITVLYVPLIAAGRDGGDEERPHGVDSGVEGAFDREGEEERVQGIGEGEDGGVEARHAESVLVWDRFFGREGG